MSRARKTQTGTTSSALTTSASAPAASSVRARKTTTTDKKPVARRSAESGNKEEDGYIGIMPSWAVRNRWIVYAVASGACAAFNGVFAKLTTNELSTHIARSISGFLRLTDLEGWVEVVVRAGFFGLNLAFNGVMWTLFTQALAKGNSTTQVSIMNTSTNFMITAVLGFMIFSESLPPLWWVGATLLVAGNVIIGRGKQEESAEPVTEPVETDFRDEVNDDDGNAGSTAERGRSSSAAANGDGTLPVEKDDEDEDVALIGDVS
ncbi:hypothetical protein F5Y04DRAFT_240061 [Hypomontagnella monticulosa]|nr:hypothetical protein F5Y04DRAFT_240061 [Hypomontagnella monticulosa]